MVTSTHISLLLALVLATTTSISSSEIVAEKEHEGNDGTFKHLPGSTALQERSLQTDVSLGTVFAAIGAAGIDLPPGPFTLFAPEDNAFGQIDEAYLNTLLTPSWQLHLQDVLKYHVVLDDKVSPEDLYNMDGMDLIMANGEATTVVVGDLISLRNSNEALSGVIEPELIDEEEAVVHVMDTVMLPSFVYNNIVDVAVGAGIFSTLVAAVQAAGLVDDLGQGPALTVFAPTDEAFAKLPEGTVDGLLQDTEALRNILLYHVVEGVFPSTQLPAGSVTVPALNQDLLEISVTGSAVVVNDASSVVAADVLASNGIIHIIDTVLLPPS